MRTDGSDVFDLFSKAYASEARETLSLQEYLLGCRDDAVMYATAPERMLSAIGEAKLVDTSTDERLGRIFANRTIKIYPSFSDFFGMEETIERIVGYFRYAAQGLEERKQILYLLGPVGGGKSSLAERLKKLMEEQPIYTLAIDGKISPVFESPLGLFSRERMGDLLEEKYGVAKRRLTGLISPWATKRLDEIGGDISKFSVVRLMPSRLRQIAIAKTEPGDENNQDVSALVGKVDIRQLENFSQADPDAYSHSGGLNRTTQGLLEFVEMFKAPIKVLHPLLTATQEGSYNGTENFGAFPYQGIVLAHSNESEWLQFKHNKNNEAFLDRILVVKVPYCLRVTEERLIYEKLLRESELSDSPCAPEVLENLSRFTVATRLTPHENSPTYTKMRVYDGENLKDTDPKAKSLQEYRDAGGVDEGMNGISTRFAFKVLSETFNYDTKEVAADPVHLMYILEQAIRREQFPKEVEANYLDFIRSEIAARYAEFIGHEIQKAYLESYSEYGQNLFDRYIAYADAWLEDQDFKDPDTGQILNRDIIDSELSQIEKPAGIANPKDFRNEVVKFTLRVPRSQRRSKPRLDELRKAARSHRKAHVRPGRRPPAGHQLRLEEGRRHRKAARRFCRAHDRAGLYRAAGPAAGRLVHARQQGWLTCRCGGQAMPNFIDRRLNPKDRSLGNRQRFIKRVHDELKRSISDRVKSDRIADVDTAHGVPVPNRGADEPGFRNASTSGERQHVLPGNQTFSAGDRITKPETGGQGTGRGPGRGEGEDDFLFVLSRDEVLDLFFEDLELPDMVKLNLKETVTYKLHRVGFTTSGTPSNINVGRTMRNSFGRRIALHRPSGKEYQAVVDEIAALEAEPDLSQPQRRRFAALHEEMEALEQRRKRIAYVDPADVRFNRFERQPLPNANAVMFCLMDVSASMGEREKDLAKRFFVLLHLFLKRRYERIDIVFIRHTDEAREAERRYDRLHGSGGNAAHHP